MIVAIGLDFIALPRFSALYSLNDRDLLERVFTQNELQIAGSGRDAAERLAARFAAKEAVLKVIGGLRDGIALTDIEIATTDAGACEANLRHGALEQATKLHIAKWHLSLTHSDEYAGAVAIGMSEAGE
jgi:holo-[acyl-carrier protein] synthase